MRGKIFGSVLPCRRSGFFLAHCLVDEFRGFGGDDLQHRTADRAHGQRLQNIASRYAVRTHHKFPFCASASRYSEARHDSAMIVSVGFLSALVTKDAPSVTKRFFTSCAWQ